MGLCRMLSNWFYEVNLLQKLFGDKTQLSCIYHVNAHDEHFLVRILRTYCCRLIQPVKMYVIWYMMWYLEKDMFCKEHDLFGCFVIFETVCPSSVFQSVWPSSIFQRTHTMWNSFVHVHVLCTHVKFYDHVHNRN